MNPEQIAPTRGAHAVPLRAESRGLQDCGGAMTAPQKEPEACRILDADEEAPVVAPTGKKPGMSASV